MRKVWADLPLFRKVERLYRHYKDLEKRVEALEDNTLIVQERVVGDLTYRELVPKNGKFTISLEKGIIQQN